MKSFQRTTPATDSLSESTPVPDMMPAPELLFSMAMNAEVPSEPGTRGMIDAASYWHRIAPRVFFQHHFMQSFVSRQQPAHHEVGSGLTATGSSR